MHKLLLLATLIILFLGSCTQAPKESEFRAVWIATVANIDWPKKGITNPDDQKRAIDSLLDYYADLKFNAVIVQVRSASDALYPSQHAPWSRFLTGKEGQAPTPFYDPIQYMIEACHLRGLEFHAWMNPYRATTSLDTTLLAPNHVFFQHPEWMIKYGKKYLLNPGLPRVREHLLEVTEELITRYDLDGLHFDDYFYPYSVKDEEFDDIEAYIDHGRELFTNIDDWRRNNVNQLVRGVHETIQKNSPGLLFGISPFGVWRNQSVDPNGSDTNASQTNYDDLYADPLTWMREGWVDYIAPQLYFSMDFAPASYRKLAYWWANESRKTGVPVYVGMGAYKVENNHDQAWYDLQEIHRQLSLNRSLPQIQGEIYFSAKSLVKKPILANSIKNLFYEDQKIPWINETPWVVDHLVDTIYTEQQTTCVQLDPLIAKDTKWFYVYDCNMDGDKGRLRQKIYNGYQQDFLHFYKPGICLYIGVQNKYNQLSFEKVVQGMPLE